MENFGIKRGYYVGMGHTKDRCWKHGKDGKTLFVVTNYLQVLVDDEEATLEQLNRLCGINHDIFTKAKIPRMHLPIKSPNVKVVGNKETKHVDVGKNYFVR